MKYALTDTQLRRRRNGRRAFLIVYLVLVVALAAGAALFLRYARECLVRYEDSQLSHFVSSVTDGLNAMSGEELGRALDVPRPEGSRFDDAEAVYAAVLDGLASARLTSVQKRGVSVSDPVFDLLADGEKRGSFTVHMADETVLLGLLSIPTWEFAGGQIDVVYDSLSYRFTLPEGFTVTLNGIALEDGELTGERSEIDAYEYVREYAEMPDMVTYAASGLLTAPEAVILDNLGEPVDFELSENVELGWQYTPSDVPAELLAEFDPMEAAQTWSKFMTNEFGSAYVGLKRVKPLLIPDSYYWQKAVAYANSKDVTFVSAHSLAGILNERLSDYISFGENCFSCAVYFEKNMYMHRSGDYRLDVTDSIFYFVKLDLTDNGANDPSWYIADMQAATN